MTYWLRSNGVPLETIAPYSTPQVSWIWGGQIGGGLGEITWEMDTPFGYQHPCLVRGALVELMLGGEPMGRGILAQPGRTDTGSSYRVPGVQREAEHYYALSATDAATTKADAAIDQAIADGLAWTRPTSIRSTPLRGDDAPAGLTTLDVVLAAVSDAVGKRWWVDGYGVVHLDPDQTTPRWQIVPGVVDLEPSDDTYASVILGRYVRANGTYATVRSTAARAAAMYGRRFYAVDLTTLGPLSDADALAYVRGLLAKGKSSLSFSDRIDVSSDELLTADGAPAPLSAVRAGDVVRVHGSANPITATTYTDLVLGEVADPQDGPGGSITIAAVEPGVATLADAFALYDPKTLSA